MIGSTDLLPSTLVPDDGKWILVRGSAFSCCSGPEASPATVATSSASPCSTVSVEYWSDDSTVEELISSNSGVVIGWLASWDISKDIEFLCCLLWLISINISLLNSQK